jgi:hypothetical protein
MAAEAGMAALRQGGTALDAAIATQMVLGLVEPQSSGIGGGAFLVFRSAEGRLRSWDGRETAPAAASDAGPGEQSELALSEEPALVAPDRRPSRTRGQARPDAAAAETAPDAAFEATTAGESRRGSAAKPARPVRDSARSAARAAN